MIEGRDTMELRERIDHSIDSIKDEMKAMGLEIHANPELGLNEYKACALQVNLLRKYGFEVEEKYCGFDTAYKASYIGKKQGPKIAMLAEYDALPEIGHGCGHNLIATVSVAAGIAMREFADEFGAEIYVIGTPAEETTGCKAPMSEMGAFDDMDVAMMTHPLILNLESPNTLAVKSVKFKYHGKTAHAAGMPEDGVNALDAVISLFNMINALRQQTKEDARIHGIITKGGEAPNIIPDYAEAFFFVRAAKIDYLEPLFEKVCNCAKGAALGTGCTLEIELCEGQFCDTNSNHALTAINTAAMNELGVTMISFGDKPASGSSDMGNASYHVPAIQSGFDITQGKYAAVHTREFAELSCSDYALDQAILFAKGFVMTGVELMRNPEHLKKIHEEFAKISRRPAD